MKESSRRHEARDKPFAQKRRVPFAAGRFRPMDRSSPVHRGGNGEFGANGIAELAEAPARASVRRCRSGRGKVKVSPSGNNPGADASPVSLPVSNTLKKTHLYLA